MLCTHYKKVCFKNSFDPPNYKLMILFISFGLFNYLPKMGGVKSCEM